MRPGRYSQSNWPSVKLVLIALALSTALFIAMLMAGCASTVTPTIVHSSQASWDGNQQNSGLLAFNEDGSARITAHARDRYNTLIQSYGTRFAPPLSKDAGVTPSGDNFVIDAQHFAYFLRMAEWKKQGVQ